MNYALAPDWSFCTAGGRTILLDLSRDRYLTLPTPLERSFEKIRCGDPLGAEDEGPLETMQGAGMLIPSCRQPVLSPVGPLHFPNTNLYRDGGHRARGRDVMSAALRLFTARREAKMRPLQDIVRALRTGKATALTSTGRSHHLALSRLTSAYRALEPFVRRHDLCLPRSIALAQHLFAKGVPAEFVMAVKCRPFGAHCWVQANDALLNDDLEVIRDYVPILVI